MPPTDGLSKRPAARARPHPDAELAETVQAALAGWLAEPCASPTSQITGGGAIAAVEAAFSRLHDNRPSLLLPSGTYALRVALQACGVTRRSEVLIPAYDWTASRDAVTSLGARAMPVEVTTDTATIDPIAAASARTEHTAAAIACHLHGIPADIPALRQALPGLPVIEDCCQALGATLDERIVGTLADAAAFSLGPGKSIDAGEGAILITSTRQLHRKAIAVSAHPVRQLLAGIAACDTRPTLPMRPHPLAAILALHSLRTLDLPDQRTAHAHLVETLTKAGNQPGILGADSRRQPVGQVAAAAPIEPEPINGIGWQRSGATRLDDPVGTPTRTIWLATRDRDEPRQG